MSCSARVIVALLALLGGILVMPSAVLAAATPKAKTAAREGPSGRYMLDGEWHERPDPGDSAVRESLPASTSLTGWRSVTVPLAANAGDFSPSSYTGSVHWYRKDFRLPSRTRRIELALPLRVGQPPRDGCGSMAGCSGRTWARISPSS